MESVSMIKRGNQQNVVRDEVLEKSGEIDNAEERVQEMVNEQKMALPDAYQKYEILKAWVEMRHLKRAVGYNWALNGKNFDPLKVYEFRLAVCEFYDFIRCMVLEKQPKLADPDYKPTDLDNKIDKAMFTKLHNASFLRSDFSWDELIKMMAWLDEKSHNLGITNLLMMPRNPLDDL